MTKTIQSEYWLNVGVLVLICMMPITKTTGSKWISFKFSIPFIEYMSSYNYAENRILYLVLPPLPSSKPQKFFVLPWHKVHCCIFKQCSEDKKKTYSHPDVNSFYIRHLQKKEARNKIMESCTEEWQMCLGTRLPMHTEIYRIIVHRIIVLSIYKGPSEYFYILLLILKAKNLMVFIR